MSRLQAPPSFRNPGKEVVPCLSPPSNKPPRPGERPPLREPLQMMQGLRRELGAMTRQVESTLDWCSQLLHDRFIMQNQDMLRDMEHLRERITAMSHQLEDTIRTMDRLMERPSLLRLTLPRTERPLAAVLQGAPALDATE